MAPPHSADHCGWQARQQRQRQCASAFATLSSKPDECSIVGCRKPSGSMTNGSKCASQAWAEQIPSSAVEAGATVVEDERPSYAMHWRDLREFYRVGFVTLCSSYVQQRQPPCHA